jgi:hypothetical protein
MAVQAISTIWRRPRPGDSSQSSSSLLPVFWQLLASWLLLWTLGMVWRLVFLLVEDLAVARMVVAVVVWVFLILVRAMDMVMVKVLAQLLSSIQMPSDKVVLLKVSLLHHCLVLNSTHNFNFAMGKA